MKERAFVATEREAVGLNDGSITRILRVIDPQPDERHHRLDLENGVLTESIRGGPFACWEIVKRHVCPFGSKGDRLFVKEDYAIIQTGHSTINAVQQQVPYDPAALYRADGHRSLADAISDTAIISGVDGWKSSADHWQTAKSMPRWASRTLLDLTDVRVIRVQDITEEDAEAFGTWKSAREDIMSLDPPEFREIIGPDVWDRNDYVWLGAAAKVKA